MASIFFLLTAALFLFQIPRVQTLTANLLADLIIEKTGYEVEIEKAYLTSFDVLQVDGLHLRNPEGDSLIDLKKGQVQFNLYQLYRKTKIPVQSIKLENPKLILRKNEEEELEIQDLILQLFPKSNRKNKAYWDLSNVIVEGGSLRFSKPMEFSSENSPTIVLKGFRNIDLQLRDLFQKEDSAFVEIELFHLEERTSGLFLDIENTTFNSKELDFRLNSLRLRTNGIELSRSLRVRLENDGKIRAKNIDAQLEDARIFPSELAALLKDQNLKALPKITLNGEWKYADNEIEFRKARILSDGGSELKGNFYIEDLSSLNSSFIQAHLSESKISGTDLSLVSKRLNTGLMEKFGFLMIDGFIEGFVTDFVAKGRFITQQGLLLTDLNFKKSSPDIPVQYSGTIGTRDFALGDLFEPEIEISRVNLNGEVAGSNLNLEGLNLIFEGQVDHLEIYQRPINNIELKGNLSQKLFSGLIDSKDQNLDFSLNGTVNLHDSSETVDVDLMVQKADLYKLDLTDNPSGFVLEGKVNIQNFNPDSILGLVLLKKVNAYNNEKELRFDSLKIVLEGPPEQRIISLHSDYLDLLAEGNFDYAGLKSSWPKLEAMFGSILQPGSKLAAEESINSYIHAGLNLKNISPILSFLKPGLIHGGRGLVEMDYSWGTNDHLDFNLYLDTLFYQGDAFIQNHLHFNLGRGENGITMGLEGLSENQILSTKTQLQETRILVYHQNDELDIHLASAMEDRDWFQFGLNGNGKIQNDTLKFSVDPNSSRLSFLGKSWKFNTGNEFSLSGEGLKFDSLGFFTDAERIIGFGEIRDATSRFEVDLDYFNLVNLNPFIVNRLTGNASGALILENDGNEQQFMTNLLINDFTFNDLLVGDLTWTIERETEEEIYDLALRIDHLGEEYFNAEGRIFPKEEFAIDMNSSLREVDLHFLEPLLEGVLSDISGKVSGNIRFSGNLRDPEVHGILLVNNGKFKVDYLNSSFRVEDQILMGIDRILFSNSKVFDQQGNPVKVIGGIFHDGFKNLVLDMSYQLDNNLLMDIPSEQNDLFFGTGIASGDIKLFGSIKDVLIDADIVTEEGTKIFIPFDNAESVAQTDQIRFLSKVIEQEKDEKKKKKPKKENNEITGLKLTANLDINEKAEVQLLLDQSTDDRIWGRGNGEMTMEIDTRGDFQLLGNYEITQGTYNFTMLNIINKQFEIEEGSSISWTGDPYKGIMNVSGLYKQHVSLQPLMISADSLVLQTSQAKRRYPVDVELKLSGEVLTPGIGFGIDIMETPVFAGYDFNSDKLAFYNRIQNDEDEMNRQVFSLIMLRRFSQDGAYFGQTASGNVSELLSNQLSNYLSQVDENFEIDFDISGFSEADLKNMQLRMSYQFMEGKLKVSREGGFYNATDEADVSSVIGDWTIEYLLSDDGRLRVRVFNRNNPNVYSDIEGQQSTVTGGFSLMYTQNFNNFSELFKKEKDKPNP